MTLFPEKHPSTAHPARNAGVSPAAPAKPHWDDRGRKQPLILHFDGGSRGNPGPAGIGLTLTTTGGTPVYELGEFLGHHTNNFAEYTALLRGLAAAQALGAAALAVRSDSELLVRQINGIYKVKNPGLKPLFRQAIALIDQIGAVTVSHVYREANTRADELANLAMDSASKLEPLGPLPACP
jgi:ribonuclease HI